MYKELVFAVSLSSLSSSPRDPALPASLSFSPSWRLLRAYTEHGRGIIFAVLPIQLCVRRKAAFNKSLIKGKQCGVLLSRAVLVSSASARARIGPSLSSSAPRDRSLRRDYRENRACRRMERIREKERDSRKDRSCHAPMALPKSRAIPRFPFGFFRFPLIRAGCKRAVECISRREANCESGWTSGILRSRWVLKNSIQESKSLRISKAS